MIALAFDFVPEHLRHRLVDALVQLIHDAGDHLDTGFLSVPYLLDALWDNGQRDLARTLLFQDTAPSWLYEVERGATTIWEGWEAIAPDGTVTEFPGRSSPGALHSVLISRFLDGESGAP